jgi:hypothetical protein
MNGSFLVQCETLTTSTSYIGNSIPALTRAYPVPTTFLLAFEAATPTFPISTTPTQSFLGIPAYSSSRAYDLIFTITVEC